MICGGHRGGRLHRRHPAAVRERPGRFRTSTVVVRKLVVACRWKSGPAPASTSPWTSP